eukprot:3896477-Pyramimonas_sp.AAC.2
MAESLPAAQATLDTLIASLPKGWKAQISSSKIPGKLYFCHNDGGTTTLYPQAGWPTTILNYQMLAARPAPPLCRPTVPQMLRTSPTFLKFRWRWSM